MLQPQPKKNTKTSVVLYGLINSQSEWIDRQSASDN